jgi:hypothetical protein
LFARFRRRITGKVPSYYAILAPVADTAHILPVKNRSGNVHGGKARARFCG